MIAKMPYTVVGNVDACNTVLTRAFRRHMLAFRFCRRNLLLPLQLLQLVLANSLTENCHTLAHTFENHGTEICSVVFTAFFRAHGTVTNNTCCGATEL